MSVSIHSFLAPYGVKQPEDIAHMPTVYAYERADRLATAAFLETEAADAAMPTDTEEPDANPRWAAANEAFVKAHNAAQSIYTSANKGTQKAIEACTNHTII